MRDYKLILNLVTNEKPGDKIFKQYDTGNEIELELYQNEHLNVDEKLVLTNESVLAFFKRQDGQVLQKNCSIRNGNVIVTTSKDVLGVPGILELECLVKKGDVETTTTRMTFTVQESIARDGAIEEDPRYTSDLVTELLDVRDNVKAETIGKIEEVASQLEEKVNKEQGKGLSTNDYNDTEKAEVYTIKDKATKEEVKRVESRIDNIISNNQPTDGNTELIDIRVGENGVIYKLAGDSIRSQLSNINDKIKLTSKGYINFPRELLILGGMPDTGEYNDRKYTLATKELVYADRDISISCGKGFKFGVGLFSNSKELELTTGYIEYIFIPKGKYFRITIQSEPETYTDLKPEEIELYKNNLYISRNDYEEKLLAEKEHSYFSFNKFKHGTIVGGNVAPSNDSRLFLDDITYTDHDIELSVEKGFKFSCIFYNNANKMVSETGFRTENYIIPKNSRFRILVGDKNNKFKGFNYMDYILYRAIYIKHNSLSLFEINQKVHSDMLQKTLKGYQYVSADGGHVKFIKVSPNSSLSRYKLEIKGSVNIYVNDLNISLSPEKFHNDLPNNSSISEDIVTIALNDYSALTYNISTEKIEFKSIINIQDNDLVLAYTSYWNYSSPLITNDLWKDVYSLKDEFENIKNNVNVYNYSYQGEKIITKKHGLNCDWVKKFSWNSFADKLENTGFQGIAEQNKVVFSAHTSNYVSLHDFNTCELIAHFEAPQGGHGNSCGFLNKKFNTLDEFNIFWVTPNTSSTPSICFYRITRESATLVKKITFALEDCGYYSDFCVNNENMHLYGIGYTKNSYSDGNENPMKCVEFDISNIELDGGDSVHLSEPLKTFTVPFISTGQGKTCFNGKMYLISSLNIGYADTKIYGIDYSKEKIATILDQFSNGVKSAEIEGLFFKEDNKGNYDLYLMDIYGETYKVEFE